jgi:hypothetical protein
MAERHLRSRSHSVAREVDGASLDSESDRARIEVDEEPNKSLIGNGRALLSQAIMLSFLQASFTSS